MIATTGLAGCAGIGGDDGTSTEGDDSQTVEVTGVWSGGEEEFTAVADHVEEQADVDIQYLPRTTDSLLTGTLMDYESGEQWDRPNGWAPLHWMAVVGLRRYGHRELAEAVTERWLGVNRLLFDRTGRMAEKYDVRDLDRSLGHGEYALQYGFGWTNGVATALQRLRRADVDDVA